MELPACVMLFHRRLARYDAKGSRRISGFLPRHLLALMALVFSPPTGVLAGVPLGISWGIQAASPSSKAVDNAAKARLAETQGCSTLVDSVRKVQFLSWYLLCSR